jgi:hypothetical protein
MAKTGYKATEPIIRFNQKYIIDSETGCWIWQNCSNKQGYGLFRHKKRSFLAHRFAYEYYVGPLDDKLMICHECNNTRCVNPDHLRQDTRLSNSIDMVKIKRQQCQILSVEEVIEIKKALLNPYIGQNKDLAHFYKVHPDTISQIKRNKNWSWVVI